MPEISNSRSLNFFAKLILTIFFAIFSGLSIVAQTVNSQPIVTVSAADYRPDSIVAADSIVAGFGLNLATGTEAGQDTNPSLAGIQLPKTLQGTRVLVNGVEADLFYVGPGQINYLVPRQTALGVATIRVESQNGAFITNGTLQIAQVAPGIFTASQDGSGVPSANVLRVKSDGMQVNEPVSTYDAGIGRFLAKPIDLGPQGETVFLILYLTGVRNAPDPNADGNANETVRVLVNGNELVPYYSGIQPNYVGLDQINVELPRYLLGNSALDIQIKVNGLLSNRSNVELVAPNLASLSWRARGLSGRTIRNFATLGSYLFAATNEGVFRSSDNGANWVLGSGFPNTTQFLSLAVWGNVIYAGSEGSGVFVSYDNGTNWTAFSTGLSGLALTVNSLSFDGSTFYASTSGGVCRYNRALNTWEALNAGLSGVDLFINNFLSDGGVSYIATNGGVCRYNRTTNTWEAFRTGLPAATRILSLVSANGVLYAGTNGSGLCRYNRTTNQWEAVGGGLPSTGIVTSVIIDGRRCFVGTRGGGVFVSNDAGVSWQSLISGLSANDIYALWLNGGAIFAGANLGGVYGAPLSSGNFVAYSQSVAVSQNTPRGIILGGTDFSLNPLTYSILFQPNNGTLSGTAPNLVYTPANNFVGSDAFIFRINNGATNSGSATVYITVSPSTAPPVNTPPVANSQSVSTNSGSARAIILSASDVNGDALTYSVVTPPTNGILSGTAPNILYTPTAGYNGVDSFTFKANDGKADSNIATVSISITAPPANRTPVISVPQAQTIGVGQQLNFLVSGTDPDAGQVLTFSVTSLPLGANFNPTTRQFTWIPLASQVGSYTVSFTVTDNGSPNLSDTKTVTITVPNRAPTITVPAAQSTSTGQLITFTVSATDPDTNQTLTLSATNLPSGATFTAATGVFAWTPSAVGISTVTFTATDNGNPPLSDSRNVNISVLGSSPNGFWNFGGASLSNSFLAFLVDGNEIFVGTPNGVYRSNDNGATFTALNNGLQSSTYVVQGLSVVDTTLYAGVQISGLYRSTDRGANWTKVTANGVNGSIYSVVKLGTTLIAITPSTGIYYSLDGTTWTLAPNTNSNFLGTTNSLVVKGGRAFISSTAGVFSSTDGITWTAANNGIAPTGNFRVVSTLAVKGDLLYVLDSNGLKVSTDDGRNWSLVNSAIYSFVTNLSGVNVLAGGNALIVATGSSVFYSPDGGINFVQMNTGDVPTGGPTAISSNTVYRAAPRGSATNIAGVYYSPFPNITANRAPSIAVTGATSGTTGSPINLTFSATDPDAGQAVTLASIALPNGATFTPTTGAFSWTPNTPGTYTVLISAKDNGTPALGDLEAVTITVTGAALVGNWSAVNPGTPAVSFFSALAVSGTNVFAGDGGAVNYNGVYTSTNNGTSWMQVNNGLTVNLDRQIRSLTPIGSNLYAGTGSGLFVSNNNGASWTKLNGTLLNVTSVAAQGNTLFAGTLAGLYFSTDSGATWTVLSVPGSTLSINSVIANDGYIFAGTSGGFYRSANGGVSWEGFNPDPTIFNTFNATSLAINGTTLYVSSSNDWVYRSTNNGSTWTKLTNGTANGLPTGGLSAVAKVAAGSDIVFATVSNGLYFSTDNGASWKKMDAGTLPSGNLVNFAVSSTHVYATNGSATMYLSPLPAGGSNTAPALTVPAAQSVTVGQNVSFAVTATDADAGQTTTLSAQGMPLGASFISSTGQFNWTPGIAGSFVVGFTVIDSGSPVLSQTKTVTITVTPPTSSPNGFWTSTSGLIGVGNVNSLLSAGTTMYASGDTSVSRSTDNGLSWAKIGTAAINANASSFKLLAANGMKLYLKSNYGLHRSNDNGATWTAISTGIPGAGSNASTMLVNGTTLFLGDAVYGIWRSSDDGTTWSQVFRNSNVSSFVSTGSTIFAGLAGSGVLRSTNNGASWTGVNSGLTNFSVNSLALNGVTLFAGTNLGVFRSIDNGTSWTAVNTGLPANLMVNDLKAGNNFIYAGTASGVYFSANNGGNWTVMDAGETPTSVTSLAITNTKIFARNQLGVVITSPVPTISSNATPVLTVPAAQNATTTNALTFTVSATDANAGQTITLSAAGLPSGATFNAATGQFLWTPNAPATVVVGFTATDSGAPQLSDTKTVTITATGVSPSGNWQNVSAGSQLSVTTLAVLGTEVFVGTSNGVHKTTNDGQTWTAANSGIPASTYIYSLSVVNGNIYAGANGTLYTSNDGGASWVSVSNGLPGVVMTVVANGATLLAGTNGFGVYRSTNGGSTWTSSSTGLPATSRVSTILVSGTNIFASLGNENGGTGGVYLSTDGGLNWTTVNTGLPASGLLVYSIVLKDASIYAATQSGLYVTSNNGTSWTVVGGGLPTTSNNALSLAVSGSNLFVGYVFGTPIYATTNGGTSWSAMTVGENVSYVSSIVVKGNKVFALNSSGAGGIGTGSVFVSPVPGT